MKLVKIIFLLLILAVVALFTAPYWASCGMNHQLCELSCKVKHYDSDLTQASCKATCVADRVACEGSELAAPVMDN